jgi:predicted acyltransferase
MYLFGRIYGVGWAWEAAGFPVKALWTSSYVLLIQVLAVCF